MAKEGNSKFSSQLLKLYEPGRDGHLLLVTDLR